VSSAHSSFPERVSCTQPLLVYHYCDGNNNGTPTLGLNELYFDFSGCPYIQ
jgi:hypothetical protein